MNTAARAYARATWFSVIFCAMTALILPVGYFIVSYQYLRGTLETEAEINARLISRLVSQNPDLWRYETVRIEELLSRRPQSGPAETRRIFDREGTLVAESVNELPAPNLTAPHTIHDGGVAVGRIEVSRSLRPILLRSMLAAVVGLGLGLILYRLLPFQEVVRAGRKLQESNDFLTKVMEGSTNSLVVLDLAGLVTMFNRHFQTLTDRSVRELQGRPFPPLFDDDARRLVETELGRVSQGQADQVCFETHLSRWDGRTLHLFLRAVPLISDGDVSGVIVSIDDLTERVEAEKERLRQERQYQQTQKLESLGVLAGGIAHDFNNILTIIVGYCFVLKEELKGLAHQAELVGRIEEAAGRASRLCQQMLTYAGKHESQHVAVDLQAQVEELVGMLRSGIKKNVAIELESSDHLQITGDSGQIQQIIVNLIMNAAEAIGAANGTIRIALKQTLLLPEQQVDFAGVAIPAGSYACLQVSDDGCGMDDETRRRVCEPFFTTKFIGRGLGMSATLGIVRSHEGALQLESSPGSGTTATVYLPLKDGQVLPPPAVAASAPHEPATGATILVVDDESDLLRIGALHFRTLGFTTIAAANGLEALARYQEQGRRIDLVLLDLLMPEMGGIETYRQLRRIAPQLPIVFCSGVDGSLLDGDILADRYVRFIPKPYQPDQLGAVVQEMVRPTG